MQNFRVTFETRKRSFVSAFSICMAVSLINKFSDVIVNRPRNGCETVGNIKVVCIDSLKQLKVANKVAYVIN